MAAEKVHLKYSDEDIGKIFAKVAWRTSNDAERAGTKFSWDPESQYYAYCNVKDGEIIFKKPSSDSSILMGRTSSKVGDAVLASELKQLNFTSRRKSVTLTDMQASILDSHTHIGVYDGINVTGSSCDNKIVARHDDDIDMQRAIYEQIVNAIGYTKATSPKNEVDAYRVFIDQLNQNQKKGANMPGTTVKGTKTLEEALLEVLCPEKAEEKEQTQFEARKPYSIEVYDLNEKLLEVKHYDKKKDAKKYLQHPAHIGRKVVLKQEIAVYTTDVPVVEVK